MKLSKINNNGIIHIVDVKSNQKDIYMDDGYCDKEVDESLVSGDYAKVVNDKIVKDTEAAELALLQSRISEASKSKVKNLEELKISYNDKFYDANGKAIVNLSAFVTVATYRLNKEFYNGGNKSKVSMYKKYFQETFVYWINADNEPVKISVEDVAEILTTAMYEVSNVLELDNKEVFDKDMTNE